jgi:hypothetical protein
MNTRWWLHPITWRGGSYCDTASGGHCWRCCQKEVLWAHAEAVELEVLSGGDVLKCCGSGVGWLAHTTNETGVH